MLATSLGGVLLLAQGRVYACATCGCSLSTDAATGFSTEAGWRLNLQYDYIDQDQLRHGSGAASVVPDGNEFEHQTRNQYITASLSYAPNPRWKVNLQIPYVIRDHSTYGEYDSSLPLPELTTSHSASLGDVRVIGSYQGFLPTHNLGVELGIKFPSGKYGDAVQFSGGPDAGAPLDTSLQPGTGSTDVILGAYYYQALSQDYDGVLHLRYQWPVRTRFDYRPGNQFNISAGLRYMNMSDWVPQLQLNIAHRDRDTGVNADSENSAGTFVYLSPGIAYAASKQTQVYGLVQLPIYHELDGWQLAPRWTATVGISHGF
ncbi:MAG: transporter [Gammaproteobacteria bacterium]|nr:transporter [Gammaproteobacteria bacterium]